MATVKLTNVKKIYSGNVTAVHDFNLDIADKEFIVFVGPSGCGKSTTLRMVAGLEDISEGTVEIDGEVVNDLQPKDRHISMVFQNYALYPHLTVYENIAFPLRLQKNPKMSQDEIYERVTNAAQVLGITQYLTRKPKALSGGQRQRVAIGRAMVKDCKVFLMDETEAMTLGDRIVCMKDGYIMQVGTPTELFDWPANLFVAQFIGAPMMNTIKTQLTKEGNKYFVSPFGYKLEVTGEKGKLLKERNVEPKEIYLGVRPEHVTLMKQGEKGGFPVTILVNEMMGSEYHLHVATEDGTKLVVRIPTINLTDEERAYMVSGNVINVTFEGKAMHFFDIETEYNLLTDNQYHGNDDPEAPIKSSEAESEVSTQSEAEEAEAQEAAEEKEEKEAKEE